MFAFCASKRLRLGKVKVRHRLKYAVMPILWQNAIVDLSLQPISLKRMLLFS